MWTIIKINRNKFGFLKRDFEKKLGNKFKIYNPKIRFQKYKKNKVFFKELPILGDYLFCFHHSFNDPKVINNLKFSRGLKYFLEGSTLFQREIEKFISKCKSLENEAGYLSTDLYELNVNSKYKFSSGPFAEKIFKIMQLQKNKIDILIGDFKATISKEKYSFYPT